MKQTTKARGDFGEALACRYLQERGFEVVARNYMPERGIKRGEIDVIACKDGVIHFVEVKTRLVRGAQKLVDVPESQITRTKIVALNRTAQAYLRSMHKEDVRHQFDAIAIVFDTVSRRARVRYLENIFL